MEIFEINILSKAPVWKQKYSKFLISEKINNLDPFQKPKNIHFWLSIWNEKTFQNNY